jgi:tellurium resistance protein TerD
MAINLKKGQGINLTKAAPKLRIVRVGIGWDITRVLGQCDLDVCAFVLKTVGRRPGLPVGWALRLFQQPAESRGFL